MPRSACVVSLVAHLPADDGRSRALEGRDAAFYVVRRKRGTSIDSDDDVAGSGRNGSVQAGRTDAPRVVNDAHFRERGRHRWGPVRRAAVGHDHLDDRGVALLGDRTQAAPELGLLVQHREDDRDRGKLRRGNGRVGLDPNR